jgi:general secretion pathway protein F
MPGYRYKAVDSQGRETRGVMEVDSPRQARAQLREQGLFPVEVAALEAANDAGSQVKSIGLSTADLSNLTRQLSTLLNAGLTVEATLSALIEQADTQKHKQLLAGLRGDVLAGKSLAASMGRYPRVFSELYRTLVNAGESSGKLAEVLMKLADHVEEQHALKQKLLIALIYPAIVLIVSVAVVTALLIYVVPQVVGVFQNTNQTLPLLTRALLALSKFIQLTGIYWLIAGAVAAFFARRALANEAVRRRWHFALLSWPIVGRTIRARNSAQLASTLSILAGSGVPVLTALDAAAGVLGNLPMREALQRAARAVQEGASLSKALGASGLFPPVMVHLIASGEASGRLPETLASAAKQQQNEVTLRVSAFAALAEPALILTMGIVVLLIVLAILMPIFELNQLVGR